MSNSITTQQAQPLNDKIETLVDRIFEQLLASCPSIQYWTEQQIITAKRQWILGFAENGIKTIDQVRNGMRELRTKQDDFVPSIGKFISWCKSGNDYAHLGLPSADELLARFIKFIRAGGLAWAERFKFANDLEYHLLTKLDERSAKGQWSDKDTRQGVKEILNEWADKLSRGEPIPPRRQQLPETVKIKPSLDQELGYLSNMRAMLKGARQGATA